MANVYGQHYSTRVTPQSEPIPGKDMVPNSAGGHAFALDDWGRLERFLILGSEGGTYYIDEKTLTVENAEAVRRCIQTDGRRVVDIVVQVSQSGRAPKNTPALFVLAMCASMGEPVVKQKALAVLPKVARIGTHLFQFATFVEGFRGWGRGLRKGVARWYEDKPVSDLAYQAIKYQQRDGWSHRDLLRLSHPKATDPERKALFNWICGRPWGGEDVAPDHLGSIIGFDTAKDALDATEIAQTIRGYRLPREAVPTEFLNDIGVWEALLEDMPMHAMVRNLGKMTSIGLIKPLSTATGQVTKALLNEEAIRKSRLHPISILMAQRVYANGSGWRGKLTWSPVPQVIDALDKAFYMAFKNVKPTGKNILLGLDVSTSMMHPLGDAGIMTPAEGATAMAMVTMATEPNHYIHGFTRGGRSSWGSRSSDSGDFSDQSFKPIPISAGQRLDDAMRIAYAMGYGGTDCAIPMLYATRHDLDVDAFVIYTDNETWAGGVHPSQALDQYRQKSGRPAKLIVVGMTSNGFSIADPNDAGMMDVVGFDANAPSVIADFVRN
jgi:60 kDa SS-A/Ro ribonucleoprotein